MQFSAVFCSASKRVFLGGVGWVEVGGLPILFHNSSYVLDPAAPTVSRTPEKNILFEEIIYIFSRLHFVNSSFSSMLSPSKIIEVPKHFCELDRREECKAGECLRYDPKKFK